MCVCVCVCVCVCMSCTLPMDEMELFRVPSTVGDGVTTDVASKFVFGEDIIYMCH